MKETMEETLAGTPRFPQDLLEWAGHHAGGVKRLFDADSGRPGKELLRTNLITRLEQWAHQITAGAPATPRILLLVGGPGNGKTEAIEHTIRCIDEGLAADGNLIAELSKSFHPSPGQAVPRVIQADAGNLAATPRELHLEIVQDASVTAGHGHRPAPELLIEELLTLLEASDTNHYLCCVNRGVLDDALIHALDHDLNPARELLEAITRSVSLSSSAPTCWPLAGFPSIAIWPMDAESLLVSPGNSQPSPASVLLKHATNPGFWPSPGECSAGEKCPFCHSKTLLAYSENSSSLLQVLRWYELASGKRWSFRDLFTLVSYLLAGHRPAGQGQHGGPCEWAKHLVGQDSSGQLVKAPRKEQLTAIFELTTSGYQQALFHSWAPEAASTLRQGIKDLGLDKAASETRTLTGLQYFLLERRNPYLPATIESLLENLVDLLDPALASPDCEVAVGADRKLTQL